MLDFVVAVVVIVVAAVVVAVVLIGLETDDILSVSLLKSEEELTVTDAVVVDTDTGWKILSICGTSAIAATTMTAHITSEAGEYTNLKFLLFLSCRGMFSFAAASIFPQFSGAFLSMALFRNF